MQMMGVAAIALLAPPGACRRSPDGGPAACTAARLRVAALDRGRRRGGRRRQRAAHHGPLAAADRPRRRHGRRRAGLRATASPAAARSATLLSLGFFAGRPGLVRRFGPRFRPRRGDDEAEEPRPRLARLARLDDLDEEDRGGEPGLGIVSVGAVIHAMPQRPGRASPVAGPPPAQPAGPRPRRLLATLKRRAARFRRARDRSSIRWRASPAGGIDSTEPRFGSPAGRRPAQRPVRRAARGPRREFEPEQPDDDDSPTRSRTRRRAR